MILMMRCCGNAQASRMRVKLWWSNWSSLCLHHPFHPTSSYKSSIIHQRHKTFPKSYWKTVNLSIYYPLSNSWHHLIIHKHLTRRRHSSGDSLNRKIQTPITHKLSTLHIVCAILDFILKHSTFTFVGIYTKPLAPPQELGWVLPIPTYTWPRKNVPWS